MSFVKSWSRRLFFAVKESMGGTFSVTTNNFTELNVKRGNSFETRSKSGPVAIGGTSEYWLLKTGPDPIIIKRRIIKTNSNEVDWRVYPDPVITDNGIAQPIINPNEVSPKTPAVQYFKNPTFSSKGTQNALDYVPGAPNVGGRSAGGTETVGFERILAPNKNYLIEVTNNGDNPLTYFLRLDWYEGPIVPLGDEEVVPTPV